MAGVSETEIAVSPRLGLLAYTMSVPVLIPNACLLQFQELQYILIDESNTFNSLANFDMCLAHNTNAANTSVPVADANQMQ